MLKGHRNLNLFLPKIKKDFNKVENGFAVSVNLVYKDMIRNEKPLFRC